MSTCCCSCSGEPPAPPPPENRAARSRAAAAGGLLLGAVSAVVLALSIAESLGCLEAGLHAIPGWLALPAIVAGGASVLRGVARSALRGRVTGHSLMTVGVVAACAIGQWGTGVLLVLFMRLADAVEGAASRRSHRALDELARLQPVTARRVEDDAEVDVPLDRLRVGDVVAVRSGERIPVDGIVVEGEAVVDQAAITGESMPVDREPGDRTFAATACLAGYLRIRSLRGASETTFSRILRLVEEAEARKSPAQRLADRFAAVYLPVVLLLGVLTYLTTGRILNAVGVLVVSCACAVVMATPLAVVASVGRAARRGLLVKGGAVLEGLARVDTLVVDKTGTLTRGELEVSEVRATPGRREADLLRVVATAEVRSEHPVGRAVVRAARCAGLDPGDPEAFRMIPGRGVVATVGGRECIVGTRRLLAERGVGVPEALEAEASSWEEQGRTVFFAAEDGLVAGMLAVSDEVRPGVAEALAGMRALGIRRQVVLTGDARRVAEAVARDLGLEVRAGLLPEDKVAVIRALQAQGAVVMMVGDGVNDAPALVQADVGVAMGRAGADVSLDVADAVLLREDWSLVPSLVRIGRRAVGVIRQNLGFALVYNGVGITLAALGLLPPVWCAAAQSLPDVVIMLNSARLLGDRDPSERP